VYCFFLAFQHLPAGICNWYIPNQWIAFFARSDWLLKLKIVSAIHILAFLCILCTSFSSFLREKKELFGAGYPLVWYILKRLFTSVSEKSGVIPFFTRTPPKDGRIPTPQSFGGTL